MESTSINTYLQTLHQGPKSAKPSWLLFLVIQFFLFIYFLCFIHEELDRRVWEGRGEDMYQRTTGRNQTRVAVLRTKTCVSILSTPTWLRVDVSD